jgi:hypothetical protein
MDGTHADEDGKSIGSGEIFDFRCDFKSEMPEDADGDLYVAEYVGELFVTLEDDLDYEEHLAGETRIFIVNADAAERSGESLWDLLDHRAETAAYIPLLGKDAGNFSAAVCRKLREDMVFSRNMLILDRLEILPRFRRQNLGHRYMRAVITRFGMGCRIAAMKPFPLQFEGKVSKSNAAEFRAATNSLKRYYERAGFESLKG